MGELEDNAPTFLALDAHSILQISSVLTNPRDLVSLQLTCRMLYSLLQPSNSWDRILKVNYGFRVSRATSVADADAAAQGQSGGAAPTHNKDLYRLLHQSASDLHSVRFAAVLTDGGVDVGSLNYWADHAFIPNSWAPYCAKYVNNVNLLAVLKAGPEGYDELTHRNMLIRCLKWVVPLLQQQAAPQQATDVRRAEEAAALLASWKTMRLETFFCQMAARVAFGDRLGLAMLAGMPGSMEDRRAAVQALGAGMEAKTYYDRAYRLHFLPERQPLQAGPGAGTVSRQLGSRLRSEAGIGAGANTGAGPAGLPGAALGRGAQQAVLDRPYVMDERAVREVLMTAKPSSSVAILHALSVSREGRLSCPVLSGVLLAGLLPLGWPDVAQRAVSALAGAAGAEQHRSPLAQVLAGAAGGPLEAYDSLLRAALEQPVVAALDDKIDSDSIFSACASGQLPPWVRHVVLEHAEFIELLPPHLAPDGAAAGPGQAARQTASDAGGPSGGAAVCGAVAGPGDEAGDPVSAAVRKAIPQLHPVVWFRFKDHAEYSRSRPSNLARTLLQMISDRCLEAASVLRENLKSAVSTLRIQTEGLIKDVAPVPANAAAAAAAALANPETELEAEAADSRRASSTSTTGGGQEGSGQGSDDGSSPSWPGDPRLELPKYVFEEVNKVLQNSERLHALLELARDMVTDLRETAGFELRAADLTAVDEGVMGLLDAMAPARDLLLMEEAFKLLVLPYATSQLAEVDKGDGAKEGEAEQGCSHVEWLGAEGKERHRRDLYNALTGGDAGDEAAVAAADTTCGAIEARMMAAGEGPLAAWWAVCGDVGARLLERLNATELGQDSDAGRFRLVEALERQAEAARCAAVSGAGAVTGVVREIRNEALLRRLPVGVPRQRQQPQPPQAAVAAVVPAAPRGAAAAEPQAVLEPPPPAGWEAEGLFSPTQQDDVDSGRVQLVEGDADEGHRVVHLVAPLMFPVAANAVLFKAVRPENLMDMVGWDDSEQPNVDIQYVGLQGRVLRLPAGVQVVPAV